MLVTAHMTPPTMERTSECLWGLGRAGGPSRHVAMRWWS